MGPCFGCSLLGHIAKDCPILQKRAEKRKEKAKQEFKRAMIAAWHDSDSSDSENKEEQAMNLCFMVNEGQIQEEETEYESSDEVDYSEFLEYSKDELAQVLVNCIECEQKYLSKIKSLKKVIRNLSFEKEALQKSNDELHMKIGTLETKKQEVQSKCECFEKLVLKFSKGRKNWTNY